MYEFDYHTPQTLADARSLLSGRDDPKLLAGGQTLLPTMKQRLAAPSDLID
ncbi:MAG TPA: carbon monoxide dehydrogenase, partial [Alphaproteobacteria bacterium]|nr:carbon monoxide dehydrogenase [Alphaproteobacteria bacterium]